MKIFKRKEANKESEWYTSGRKEVFPGQSILNGSVNINKAETPNDIFDETETPKMSAEEIEVLKQKVINSILKFAIEERYNLLGRNPYDLYSSSSSKRATEEAKKLPEEVWASKEVRMATGMSGVYCHINRLRSQTKDITVRKEINEVFKLGTADEAYEAATGFITRITEMSLENIDKKQFLEVQQEQAQEIFDTASYLIDRTIEVYDHNINAEKRNNNFEESVKVVQEVLQGKIAAGRGQPQPPVQE